MPKSLVRKIQQFIAYDINDEVHFVGTKKEASAFALERNREHGKALNINNTLWVREK